MPGEPHVARLQRGEVSMIVRIWRGWTTRADAAAYESLLRDEIFPAIAARGITGYRGVQLLRRDEAARSSS